MTPLFRDRDRRGGKPENILGYWRAIELFTPNSIPKIERHSPVRQTHLLQDGLPWGPDAIRRTIRIPKKHHVRHAIYLGVYSVPEAYEILDRVFAPDDEGLDSHPGGESACAAMLVDDDGYADLNSLVVSGCSWAVGAVNSFGQRQSNRLTGLDWVDGYEEAAEQAFQLSDRILSHTASAAGSDTGPVPLTEQTIHKLRAAVGQVLQLNSGVLDHNEIRIETFTIPTAQTGQDNHDLLNSFYVTDLGTTRAAARAGDIGDGLRQYLAADRADSDERIDVRHDLDRVFDAVAPKMLPAGRWPSPADHPAALSQQLAINLARAELTAGAGLFSINGPPGTGKTTLLRDVIASVIVDRADALAELPRPTAAFDGSLTWQSDGFRKTAPRWIPSLTGHEMVVASSNNAAVENISEEIPGAAVADTQFVDGLDHFVDIATAMLNRSDVVDESTRPAWGLIAARLGNKDNRSKFLTHFFFDSVSNRFREDGARDREGMNTLLKRMAESSADKSWEEAVADYQTARESVSQILAKRQRAADDLLQLTALHSRLQAATVELDSSSSIAHDMDLQLDRLRDRITELDNQRAELEAQVQVHDKQRPGLVARAIRRQAFIDWRKVRSGIDDEIAIRIGYLTDAAAEADAIGNSCPDLESLRAEIMELDSKIAELRRRATRDAERWGVFAVDRTWWKDTTRRELQSLWLDPECCAARSRLFVAAIELHRHFSAHVPMQLRSGLLAVNDILAGTAPSDLPVEKARAAWQTLFFFVPVVSTTFASFARMFSHLGREDIGWLLIDEAGQATPQAAAGAIWRSRRSIIVGDPLQLEPVLTIPVRLQKAISNTFGTDDKWVPARSSVQTLADSTNHWGTLLPQGDSDIWVGAPLRVHRRCESPMFDISNGVAYDGMMISAVATRPPVTLPESMWIDISGPSRGHLVPSQIDELRRILDALVDAKIDPDEIFVISPFRAVAQVVQRICGQAIRAGTIHTAQGREADVVILVLGGDPNRPGAKSWASKTPNLLNVAVSRAKRRVYAVGDRESWRTYPYFDTLAASLPVVAAFPDPVASDAAGGFTYSIQQSANPRGRIALVEARPIEPGAIASRLSLRGSDSAIAQITSLFREQFNYPPDSYTAEGDELRLDWPCGVSTGCRHLAKILTEYVALETRQMSHVDLAVAIDWYKVLDPLLEPDEWENTITGERINILKYRKPDSRAAEHSPEFLALSTSLTAVARRHPAFASAEVILSVPGSSGIGRSLGEQLAKSVATNTGKHLVQTWGPTRPQSKGLNRPNLDGLFRVNEPLTGSCIVVDDVFLSGQTLDETARAACAAGAGRVVGLVAAKTMRSN
ncbi:DEAD/DEAH box helicase [Gordonia sp. DT218]|uniref:DEAD/DEAH box helicase n=1 Tax=Gordonia sp. DT218 TaxID=3416659 RepID=UPI003CF6F461